MEHWEADIAKDHVARVLAHAFLSAEWAQPTLESAGCAALSLPESQAHATSPKDPRRLIARIVARVLADQKTPYPPGPAVLVDQITWTPNYDALRAALGPSPKLIETTAPPRFAPIPPFTQLKIPQIRTPRELADWLALDLKELDWFADPAGRLARAEAEPLRHYTNLWVPKRSGGARLIEAPKPRLKGMQRRVLREILDVVPPHDAAHGFRVKRNCQSGAELHAGEALVLTLDLESFFNSVTAERTHAIFRCLGYPWAVARLLTGLCTTTAPQLARAAPDRPKDAGAERERLSRPHLPQGAPTSPALANLAAWRLDLRLSGLARRIDATYTRYADDLAFSGDAVVAGGSLLRTAEEIIRDEGFTPHPNKRRLMPRSTRQTVTGLVVNEGLNIRRDAYDALKATLYNCVRRGPNSQNHASHPDFHAHLEGRVAWIESVNYHRGIKLRALFNQINWP